MGLKSDSLLVVIPRIVQYASSLNNLISLVRLLLRYQYTSVSLKNANSRFISLFRKYGGLSFANYARKKLFLVSEIAVKTDFEFVITAN